MFLFVLILFLLRSFMICLTPLLRRQRFPDYTKKRKEELSRFHEEIGENKPQSPFIRSHFSMLPNGWTPPPSKDSTSSSSLTSPFLESAPAPSDDQTVPTPSLPYKVLRTSRGFLPVYTDFRFCTKKRDDE